MRISEWGNSLGIRLPKALLKQAGLKKGMRVHAEVKRGKLVISPADDDALEKFKVLGKEFDLGKALKRITPENMHDDMHDWLNDGPIGKEIW